MYPPGSANRGVSADWFDSDCPRANHIVVVLILRAWVVCRRPGTAAIDASDSPPRHDSCHDRRVPPPRPQVSTCFPARQGPPAAVCPIRRLRNRLPPGGDGHRQQDLLAGPEMTTANEPHLAVFLRRSSYDCPAELCRLVIGGVHMARRPPLKALRCRAQFRAYQGEAIAMTRHYRQEVHSATATQRVLLGAKTRIFCAP